MPTYRVAITISVPVEADGRYQAERKAREIVQEIPWPVTGSIAYPTPIEPR